MKWQVTSPQTIHIKKWGDEAVIYDALSGNTHLVGAAAAQIFAQVMASPTDAGSLTRTLFPAEAAQSLNDAEERVKSILAQLAGIALISSVIP